jgi:hypothetical protein
MMLREPNLKSEDNSFRSLSGQPQLPHCSFIAFAIGFVLATSSVYADIVRVCTWDAAAAPDTVRPVTISNRIQQAANSLKQIKPDVIVLHNVTDWQMCSQFAQALKPIDYNVVVCSSFRDPETGSPSQRQTAILSNRKGYFTWSEPWRTRGSALPGGFAFAAIQTEKQRLGVFAVQASDKLASVTGGARTPGDQTVGSVCLQQWTESLDSYKKWVANRIEGAVVAAFIVPQSDPKKPLPLVEQARFANGFLGAAFDQPLSLVKPGSDYFSVRIPSNPEALPGVILCESGLTCDLDIDSSNPAVATLVESASAFSSPCSPCAEKIAIRGPNSEYPLLGCASVGVNSIQIQ